MCDNSRARSWVSGSHTTRLGYVDMARPGTGNGKVSDNCTMVKDELCAMQGINEEVQESFTLFGKLPLEIRLMILEAALPGPRIVHVEQHHLPTYPCYRVRSDVAMTEIIEGKYHDNSIAFFHYSEIDGAIFEDLLFDNKIGPRGLFSRRCSKSSTSRHI